MSEFDRFPLLYESYYPRFAESKVITVAVAVGNFAYTKLETCKSDGTKKTSFAAGETVYANISGINNGTGEDGATIVIKDVDTGTEVKRLGSAVVDPGEVFEIRAASIGTMPDHDWKLEFKMTP